MRWKESNGQIAIRTIDAPVVNATREGVGKTSNVAMEASVPETKDYVIGRVSQRVTRANSKKCDFSAKYSPKILTVDRGCPIIIWTGLNIKISIVQKVYEWPSWYFAKMIVQIGNHFGKISFITHIIFELCLFFYLA